jgi:hypothetical protein
MAKVINHPDPETVQAWTTLRIEVAYAPNTGSIKPWEVYGVFSYPYEHRTHWGSFKTEAAARRRAERAAATYETDIIFTVPRK